MIEMAFILVELWHNAIYVLDFLAYFTLDRSMHFQMVLKLFEKEGKWNWNFITT